MVLAGCPIFAKPELKNYPKAVNPLILTVEKGKFVKVEPVINKKKELVIVTPGLLYFVCRNHIMTDNAGIIMATAECNLKKNKFEFKEKFTKDITLCQLGFIPTAAEVSSSKVCSADGRTLMNVGIEVREFIIYIYFSTSKCLLT